MQLGISKSKTIKTQNFNNQSLFILLNYIGRFIYMGFIYKIVNNVNNKLYVGKTTQTIEKRFKEHIKNAKNKVNRYLYDAMNKYGYENFHAELIEECDDTILSDREIFWIKELNTFWLNGFGYNMTIGGDGGDTWSALSDESKEVAINKVKNKNIGKKRTDQQRKTMSIRYHELGKEHFKHKKTLTTEQLHEKAIKAGQKLKAKVDLNSLLYEIQYSGLSGQKIAERFNISDTTLGAICKREFGKTLKQLRKVKTEYKTGQKANIKDYESYCKIHKELALRGPKSPVYIDVDINKVISLVKDGYKIDEISDILNVSKHAIRCRCEEKLGFNFQELKKYVKQFR